jgi:molybdopterin synthase sulfur carrier subunit
VKVAHLRLFGIAREAAGTASVTLPGSSVAEVIAAATARFGDQFSDVLTVSKVWLNGDEVGANAEVSDADEVAIIPPVSGG